MRHLVLGFLVAWLAAGCGGPAATAPGSAASASASAAASPSAAAPAASPEIVCDTAQFQPAPALICRPAIAAAIGAIGPAHPAIAREEFRYGGLCPPGAPCVPPLGDSGIVIVTFVAGPPVFVYVSAHAGRVSADGSPAPYPSGD